MRNGEVIKLLFERSFLMIRDTVLELLYLVFHFIHGGIDGQIHVHLLRGALQAVVRGMQGKLADIAVVFQCQSGVYRDDVIKVLLELET